MFVYLWNKQKAGMLHTWTKYKTAFSRPQIFPLFLHKIPEGEKTSYRTRIYVLSFTPITYILLKFVTNLVPLTDTDKFDKTDVTVYRMASQKVSHTMHLLLTDLLFFPMLVLIILDIPITAIWQQPAHTPTSEVQETWWEFRLLQKCLYVISTRIGNTEENT